MKIQILILVLVTPLKGKNNDATSFGIHAQYIQVALLWQRDRATRLSVEILQLTKHPI